MADSVPLQRQFAFPFTAGWQFGRAIHAPPSSPDVSAPFRNMSDETKMQLHADGKFYCDIEMATESAFIEQTFQFGDSQPIDSRKAVCLFTRVEPVIAMGRQHSIFADDKRILIDIKRVQSADGGFKCYATLLGSQK